MADLRSAEAFSIAILKAAGLDVDPTTVTSVAYSHQVGRWPTIVVEHFARDLDGNLVPERSELTFVAQGAAPVATNDVEADAADVTTITDTATKHARRKT